MSTNFTGATFANQRVTPSDDAIIRRAVLSDGILSGCELSYSGSTLTMAAGRLLACGRQFRHAAAQNWAVADATSGYARLLLTIDLTRSATAETFDQVVDSIEYASAIDGFPALTQEDINGSGTVYQIVACVVSLGTGGITGIVSQLAQCAGAGNVPQIVSGAVVKDGNTITMTMPLDSGETMEAVIELDAGGYPAKIVCDGREIPWTWTGFDAADSGSDDTGDSGDEPAEGATYFYNAGDACEDITGGWQDVHTKSALTLNDTNMTIFGAAAEYCMLVLRTTNLIDMSAYSKLYFEVEYTGPLTSGKTGVGITQVASLTEDTDFAAYVAMEENTGKVTYEVDVSEQTGSYYITLFGYSDAADQNTGYTVYRVWAE